MQHISTILQPMMEVLLMKSCGSLWKKTSGAGNNMLSGFLDLGALGKVNIMVFPNNNKDGEKKPDFFIAINDGENGKPEKKEEKKDAFQM